MNYTYSSLTMVWLGAVVLVGLAATGMVTGVGVVLLALMALAGPALLLRERG